MAQLALAEGEKRRRRRRRRERRKRRVFFGATGRDEATVMLKCYAVKIKGFCLNDCAFSPPRKNRVL